MQTSQTSSKDLAERDSEFQAKVKNLVAQSARCEVVDDATAEDATDLIKITRTARKKIDDHRRVLTDPLNATVKEINDRYRPMLDVLKKSHESVNAKLNVYSREKSRAEAAERQRRRDAELEAAAKLEEKSPEAAAAAVDKIAKSEELESRARPTIMRGNYGSSGSVRKDWKFEVTDSRLVDDQFKEVVSKLVNQAIRDGLRESPGLRIFLDESVVIR